MKILDKYIISKFLETFVYITISLLLISISIHISQHLNRLYTNNGSLKSAILDYYPLWSLWLINTFMPISIFISIIFFTSILTINNEIIAMNSNGISSLRIIIPYLISTLIIVSISFIINHYYMPIINKKKNLFFYKYMINPYKKIKNKRITYQINNNEYIFIDNFFKNKRLGQGFTYQKFINQKMIHNIISDSILFNNKKQEYILFNAEERYIYNNKELLKRGILFNDKLFINSNQFLYEKSPPDDLNTYELKKFIKNEMKRGIKNLNIYLNELYQRSSIPFSTFVLTILAFSLSSIKNNYNDIGNNIVLGIILAFFYIFFIELFKSISINEYQSSIFAICIPNIIFSIIALFFLFIRNNK